MIDNDHWRSNQQWVGCLAPWPWQILRILTGIVPVERTEAVQPFGHESPELLKFLEVNRSAAVAVEHLDHLWKGGGALVIWNSF